MAATLSMPGWPVNPQMASLPAIPTSPAPLFLSSPACEPLFNLTAQLAQRTHHTFRTGAATPAMTTRWRRRSELESEPAASESCPPTPGWTPHRDRRGSRTTAHPLPGRPAATKLPQAGTWTKVIENTAWQVSLWMTPINTSDSCGPAAHL